MMSRLAELIADWAFLIRRGGYWASIGEIRRGILALPYRHIQYVVVARSLLTPLPELKPKVPLGIRPFRSADLKFVHRDNLPSEANLCRRRIELGHLGLVACIDGQAVGYAWGCTDSSLERVSLKFEPGDILCTDAFTVPVFRGKGVQTALSLARLRLFQGLGYKRVIAYIERHNDSSLAVWRKVGAHESAKIQYHRIGFWRKTHYRP
jgi:GNAT superfamily N-acetyltransferase